MDKVSPEIRSSIMSHVHSAGNRSTELRLIKIFRSFGVKGWRRKSHLPGKPDFVFHRQRVALFVDGCFWHGCPWHCRMPSTRRPYWLGKIKANKVRDHRIRRLLQSHGWTVIRVWEHQLCKGLISERVERVKEIVQGGRPAQMRTRGGMTRW